MVSNKKSGNSQCRWKQDFGKLCQLRKPKPKALDLAYEGNIIYKKYKRNEQRNKLTPEGPDKAFGFPKKYKSRQQTF